MLVTFSCKTQHITMFGDVALALLKIMGNSGTIPGAILADEVPDALAKLQTIIAQKPELAKDDDDQAVSLKHRALPLIDLLHNAAKQHCNVMWDKV